jgi:hypothetical protein
MNSSLKGKGTVLILVLQEYIKLEKSSSSLFYHGAM